MKRKTNLLVLVCLLSGFALINSCKKDVSLPVLTTSNVTNVTINSVTSGGVITNGGGADITARGVCWGTTTNPTISGNHTTDGTGSGTFTSNITGLTHNTRYYIRAYATNSAGTAYGNEVSVTTTAIVVPSLTTTAVTAIGLTTATSGGNITADGGATVTARGVCWATTTAPTTSNDTTLNMTGTGAFTSSLTGLTPSTTYYVRAYAVNSAGTAYGNEVSFTTSALSAPVLTTAEITAITLTTASSGGTITSDGGVEVTVKGVCYATTVNPTIAGGRTIDGSGTEAFTSALTNLTPGTKYYVRAYATNSIGTGYGNELSFTTIPVLVPTLTTAAISSFTQTTAVSGGNITADGGGFVTARGVCWSTTADPTTADSKTTTGSGTGVFVSNITGLIPNTLYHVRAFATNSKGTGYGEDVQFTTSAVAFATLTTTTATTLTQTTAVTGGNVTADGGGIVTARGVCFATTTTPTTASTTVPGGSGTGVFTSNLTGLLPATTYYVRAYAINAAGTAYGNEISFTTTAIEKPVLTTTPASLITLTTAQSGGNISSAGGGTVTARGVCYAITTNPTTSNFIISNGGGTGTFTSSITGLLPGTKYYLRAYATNSAGTAYGDEISFTTNPVVSPTVTTTAVSSITLTTAVSGGNITSDGGGIVTFSGICWSTSANPTVSDSRTTDGPVLGGFASTMTGLSEATTYYVRAYATNSAGTGYGNQLVFNTRLSDVEGNTYSIVTIGTQVWMAENLKTTTLNNSTPIDNVTDNAAWAALATPAYCWYNNDEATNKPLYGALYNWFTINTGNLCPSGWHVPTDGEYGTLELYLGVPADSINFWGWRGLGAGTDLKSTTGWAAGQNGTNTSGFTALPAGYRFAGTGTFNDLGNLTYWWTATSIDATRAWYRRVDGSSTSIYHAGTEERGGKYVRCLKN
jgi:uncharacterized protein (TIGR02145 family)